MTRRLFTSESVTEGHPDKIADQISDAVLDAVLAQDPAGRVACEVLLTGNRVFLGGEITTTANVDLTQIARNVIADIGYDDEAKGLNWATCDVVVAVGRQSPDIADGVDTSLEARTGAATDPYAGQGAGDQGLMFGYATAETATFMPVPIQLSHDLARRLTEVRKDGTVPWLRPDGKTQVTVEYDDDVPVAVHAVVVSTQHDDGIDHEQIVTAVRDHVIVPVLARYPRLDSINAELLINPSGRFVIGGPTGDAGLTGRKIIVDTYGGAARHGGGAFSGKDPSKVDRSAAYAARHVARTVIAGDLASRCEVQIAYAIGQAAPVGVYVTTFGTGMVADELLAAAIGDVFDLRPAAIIHRLGLTDPTRTTYRPLAAYGHLGRVDLQVVPSWESDELVDALRAAVAARR
jgi:S-adenosylmethionine synthetase